MPARAVLGDDRHVFQVERREVGPALCRQFGDDLDPEGAPRVSAARYP
jgi:hypothetical protein